MLSSIVACLYLTDLLINHLYVNCFRWINTCVLRDFNYLRQIYSCSSDVFEMMMRGWIDEKVNLVIEKKETCVERFCWPAWADLQAIPFQVYHSVLHPSYHSTVIPCLCRAITLSKVKWRLTLFENSDHLQVRNAINDDFIGSRWHDWRWASRFTTLQLLSWYPVFLENGTKDFPDFLHESSSL